MRKRQLIVSTLAFPLLFPITVRSQQLVDREPARVSSPARCGTLTVPLDHARPDGPTNTMMGSHPRMALEALVRAELHADLETLDRLIADDFLRTDVLRGTFTKQGILDGFRSGTVVEQHEVTELAVRVLGGTALTIGRARIRGRTAEGPYETTLGFMDVWVWHDGSYRLIAAHTARQCSSFRSPA